MLEKEKALELAVAQIEKQFGKGSIMRYGDAPKKMAVDVIPTGALALDIALGVGGIPRGRIVEIYGPEGSGKTTVALHIVAEAQKAGELPHLLMLSTLWTRCMPAISALTLKTCSFPSLTPESRRLKS